MSPIALVTGAAGGLGNAIAQCLAGAGYRVAMLDRTAEPLLARQHSIEDAIAVVADVTDEVAIDRAFDEIAAAFGGSPDLVVNNAGIVVFGDILEQSVADFRAVLDVNLVGTYIVSRAAGRRMVARGSGVIVNITSLNAVAPSPDAGAYPCSKAAVVSLTQHLALSLGPRGVRVNAVGPGFIDSGMSAPIYADPAVRSARGAQVPARRIGRDSDVAEAVLFLASDKASYIHGQHLLVDGGVSFSLKSQMPRLAPVRT